MMDDDSIEISLRVRKTLLNYSIIMDLTYYINFIVQVSQMKLNKLLTA
jgi:hypothetical protein